MNNKNKGRVGWVGVGMGVLVGALLALRDVCQLNLLISMNDLCQCQYAKYIRDDMVAVHGHH